MADDFRTLGTVRRLKQEMRRLLCRQSEALELATFVGMTRQEAAEYDERRDNILLYMRCIQMLQSLSEASHEQPSATASGGRNDTAQRLKDRRSGL